MATLITVFWTIIPMGIMYWLGKQQGEMKEFRRFHSILSTLIKESRDIKELDVYSKILKLDKEHLTSKSK